MGMSESGVHHPNCHSRRENDDLILMGQGQGCTGTLISDNPICRIYQMSICFRNVHNASRPQLLDVTFGNVQNAEKMRAAVRRGRRP